MPHVQKTLFGEIRKTPKQEYLELINKEYNLSEALDIIDKIDWDFKEFTTQYLTHKFHSYPARFIPQIPLTFIKLFTKEEETVVDPFCGCGTALVEAFLNNRNSIGNDFNPLAALISKVKTTLIDAQEFAYFKKKLAYMKSHLKVDQKVIDERLQNMPSRKISKLFNKTIISKLEVIRETLLELKEKGHDDIYDLGRVALSSTIWTLVENGNDIAIKELFMKKVRSMETELKKMAKMVKKTPEVRLICGDARRLEIETNSTDLIVTSPPYVNAVDYYRVHMYNMLWLGMDFALLRKHEIGAHSHFINNRFRLLSEYLGDMLRSMIEMNRILKDDKLCVIVVGNSSVEFELMENYKFFAEMSKKIGFMPTQTLFRNIDTSRKYTSTNIGNIDDEYILVLQKMNDTDISADNDEFIAQVAREQMMALREQIKVVQGTSIRGKSPSKERLLENIDRITEAIETIPNDIKIKQ